MSTVSGSMRYTPVGVRLASQVHSGNVLGLSLFLGLAAVSIGIYTAVKVQQAATTTALDAEVSNLEAEDLSLTEKLDGLNNTLTGDLGAIQSTLVTFQATDANHEVRLVDVESQLLLTNVTTAVNLTDLSSRLDDQADTLTDLQTEQADHVSRLDALDSAASSQNVSILALQSSLANTVTSVTDQGARLDNHTLLLSDLAQTDNIHETRLVNLETSADTQNASISTLRQVDTTHELRLEALEARADIHNESLSDLAQVNNRLEVLETSKDVQNASLSALEQVDGAHDTRLGALEASADTQNASISSLEQEKTALEARVDTINATASTILSTVDNHTSVLDAQGVSLSSLSSDVVDLQTNAASDFITLADHDTRISANQGRLDNINATLVDLQLNGSGSRAAASSPVTLEMFDALNASVSTLAAGNSPGSFTESKYIGYKDTVVSVTGNTWVRLQDFTNVSTSGSVTAPDTVNDYFQITDADDEGYYLCSVAVSRSSLTGTFRVAWTLDESTLDANSEMFGHEENTGSGYIHSTAVIKLTTSDKLHIVTRTAVTANVPASSNPIHRVQVQITKVTSDVAGESKYIGYKNTLQAMPSSDWGRVTDFTNVSVAGSITGPDSVKNYFQITDAADEGDYLISVGLSRSVVTNRFRVSWTKEEGSLTSSSEFFGHEENGGTGFIHSTAVVSLKTTDKLYILAYTENGGNIPTSTSPTHRCQVQVVKLHTGVVPAVESASTLAAISALEASQTAQDARLDTQNNSIASIDERVTVIEGLIGDDSAVYWLGYKTTSQTTSSWEAISPWVEDRSAAPVGAWTYPTGTTSGTNYWSVPEEGLYQVSCDVSYTGTSGVDSGLSVDTPTVGATTVLYGATRRSTGGSRMVMSAGIYLNTTNQLRLNIFSGTVPASSDTFNRLDCAVYKVAGSRNAAVDVVNASVSALEVRLATAETTIDALNSTVSALEARVAALEATKPYWLGHKDTPQIHSDWAAIFGLTEDRSEGTWTLPTDGTNNWFYVPVDGLYIITWDISGNVGDDINTGVTIDIDGPSVSTASPIYGYTEAKGEVRLSSSATVWLTTTNKLRIVSYNNTSPNIATDERRMDIAITYQTA